VKDRYSYYVPHEKAAKVVSGWRHSLHMRRRVELIIMRYLSSGLENIPFL